MASGPTKVLSSDSTGGAILMVNVGGSSKSFGYREGAEKDIVSLKAVFVETLGFTLINGGMKRDLYIAQWDHRLNDEGGEKSEIPLKNCSCILCTINSYEFTGAKCFVLAIGSHGYLKNGQLMVKFLDDTERNCVSVNAMIDALSDKHCPNLKGIPRVVIIQACRGVQEDDGLEVMQRETTDHASGSDTSNVDPMREPMDTSEQELQGAEGGAAIPEVEVNLKLPKNFLVVYTTTPGRVSKTNTVDGSWFENALCGEVKKTRFQQRAETELSSLAYTGIWLRF